MNAWSYALPMAKARRRVVVHGLVQGVFFRDTCRREATRLGLSGFVRNQPDGTVEAVFEGQPNNVSEMVRWCHQGPPHADVSRVETFEEEATGETGFRIY